MKFRFTDECIGVQATMPQHIVWDGGAFRIKTGEWLVTGMLGGGYAVVSDPYAKGMRIISEEETEEEAELRKVLKTGKG